MSVFDRERVVAAAEDAFGGALRSVIEYHLVEGEPGFEVWYLRSDLAERLESGGEAGDSVVDSLAREFVLEDIERAHQEELRPLGRFRASVRLFEEAAVVRVFAAEDTAGVSLSVDAASDGPLARVRAFADEIER